MEGIERLDPVVNPYLIVEFPDGVQLVASKWLTGKNKEMCFWPNFTSNSRYDNAVKHLEDVDLSWKTYPIKSIVATADTFEKGKRKLREAESFSDVNSGYETDIKKQIRRDRASKRKLLLENQFYSTCPSKKKRVEEESSEESEDEILTEINKKSRLPEFPMPPTASSSPSNVNVQTSKSQPLRSPQSAGSSPAWRLGSPKKSPFKKHTDLTEFELYTKKSITELKIKVNLILEMQKGIIEELRSKSIPIVSNNVPNEDEIGNELLRELPLKSHENLAILEEKLKDKNCRQYLVMEFRKAGGVDTKSVIFNLLPKLLTNELAQEFSWIGGKGKHIFSSLQLIKLINDVVRIHHPTATDTEIAVPVRNWLRHAKERKERLMKKRAEEPVEEDV